MNDCGTAARSLGILFACRQDRFEINILEVPMKLELNTNRMILRIFISVAFVLGLRNSNPMA